MKPKFYRQLLAICVASLMSALSYGQENTEMTEVLPTIEVQATEIEQPKVNVVQKKREHIQTEMIANNQDLVRYTTDIGIVDNGRHQKGFAMRGVEGNRVNMTVDGIAIPDYEENSLYTRYGNLNQSRLSIDPELMGTINLVRGSDSFNSGANALGGSVNYRTMSVKDVLTDDKNWGVYLKTGYASKNNEWTNTIATAFDNGAVDVLLAATRRQGHEMESLGKGEDLQGSNRRGIPDPSEHTNKSYLAKVGYRFNDAHRIHLSYNQQDNKNFTDEKSYSGFGWREALDIGKRKQANIGYEFTPENNIVSRIKLGFDWSKAEIGVINNKGSYNWSDNSKRPVSEIQDRNAITTFKQATIGVDFMPVELAGQHQFALRTGYSDKEMKMLLLDNYFFSNAWLPTVESTIQNPTQTKNYYVSLADKVQLNNIFSVDLGAKYDRYTTTPLELNARCTICSPDVKQLKFNGWSGLVGLNAQVNDTWKLAYQFSTGFRIPSATELYFSFNHPAGQWRPNPNLKEEKSQTHNLSVEAHNEVGDLKASVYQTNYKDFLFEQEGMEVQPGFGGGRPREQLYQQMINLDDAKIRGVDIEGRLNLAAISPAPDGLSVMGALGYSTGKLSNGASLLSIQPLKLVTGIDYVDPDGKWGVFSRISHARGKSAKDAQINQQSVECTGGLTRVLNPYYPFDWRPQYIETCGKWDSVENTVSYPWLNKSYTTVDLFGYYRPVQNLTLRAGVYNLTNQKYHTWDALRGTNSHIRSGTTNTIDRNGVGLERFYAPGRNYSMAIEYKF